MSTQPQVAIPSHGLPQERWKKPSLYVDLVPQSAWASNLRSILTADEWDVCKRLTYARAGRVCEVCGGRGPKWPVEAHERWHYDDKRRVQTLVDLVGLCPDCHEASHMGLANINGRGAIALAHLAKVNGWTAEKADKHAEAAFAKWAKRSTKRWVLDAKWILGHGVGLSEATIAKIVAMAEGKTPQA